MGSKLLPEQFCKGLKDVLGACGAVGGAYLLDGTLGLEEDATAQQFREDAAYRPDVNGVGIVAAPHEDLRGSVVLRHHFLGHVPRLVRLLDPSEAEVADLQVRHRQFPRRAQVYHDKQPWPSLANGSNQSALLIGQQENVSHTKPLPVSVNAKHLRSTKLLKTVFLEAKTLTGTT